MIFNFSLFYNMFTVMRFGDKIEVSQKPDLEQLWIYFCLLFMGQRDRLKLLLSFLPV